uniref:Uncharacterized protein n=1 Tax=Eptatretus burgeri TaxID=7764 RepID=A0A8C4Q1L4_EPTBU
MKKEVDTIRAEVTGLKEKVKGVGVAMEESKQERANEIKTVMGKIDKVGRGLGEVNKGQDQIREEIGKNTTAIEELKREQGKIKEGLGVVKEDCEKRHQEMTDRIENLRKEGKAETQKGLKEVGEECRKRHEEVINKMERKAGEKTEELGERIEKHRGETEEQFRTTGEIISKTNKVVTQVQGEVEQIREKVGELSLETIGEEVNEVIKGKMELMERRLTKHVGTRYMQLDSLLQERGERIYPLEADQDQVGSVVLCDVEGTGAVDRCTES